MPFRDHKGAQKTRISRDFNQCYEKIKLLKRRFKEVVDALRRSGAGVDSATEDFPLGFRWFAELHNIMKSAAVQSPSLIHMLVTEEQFRTPSIAEEPSRAPSVAEERSRAPSVVEEQPRTENQIVTVAVSEGHSEQSGPCTKDAPGSSSAHRPFAYAKYSNYCTIVLVVVVVNGSRSVNTACINSSRSPAVCLFIVQSQDVHPTANCHQVYPSTVFQSFDSSHNPSLTNSSRV